MSAPAVVGLRGVGELWLGSEREVREVREVREGGGDGLGMVYLGALA